MSFSSIRRMINVRSVTNVFLPVDNVSRGLVAKIVIVCRPVHIEGTTGEYDNFVVIQLVLVETRVPLITFAIPLLGTESDMQTM